MLNTLTQTYDCLFSKTYFLLQVSYLLVACLQMPSSYSWIQERQFNNFAVCYHVF